MMFNSNPFARPEVRDVKPPDRLAALRREQASRATRERNRQALAPYVIDCLRDSEGNPTTMVALDRLKLARSQKLVDRLKSEVPAREARKKDWLETTGKNMPDYLKDTLQDVVDGEPRFITSLSYDQAHGNGVLDIWPGGAANTDLTGAGITVAMWDTGSVLETHEQFNTGTDRIDNVDGSGQTGSEHAMAVATVIAGAGDSNELDPGTVIPNVEGPLLDTPANNARGAAYEANILVYSANNYISEMSTLAMQSKAGISDVAFSNNAFGTACGYQQLPNASWVWYGIPAHDDKVDFKHGFYLREPCRAIDELVHANEVFLPIWAAGNENFNSEYGTTLEAKEAGELYRLAHIVPATGETFIQSNAPFRTPDRALRIFHSDSDSGSHAHALGNIIPEACCKNVLSVGSGPVLSVHGPTDDLRIKPEIYATGGGGNSSDDICASVSSTTSYRTFGGSSFAAASVTGGLALVQQRWQQLNGTIDPVLASTWKGIAIGTAVAPTGVAISGPSASHGYGYFDVSRAVELVELDHDERALGSGARIFEILLQENQNAKFTVRKLAPTGAFRVLICWSDPKGPIVIPPGNSNDKVLINDLDLSVVTPDGTEMFPYLFRFDPPNSRILVHDQGINDRDNVEVVDVNTSTDGEFEVQIKSNQLENGEPQLVSVIIVGNAEAVLRPFEIISIVPTDPIDPSTYNVTWNSEPGVGYEIEVSQDLETWQVEPGEFFAIGETTSVQLPNFGLDRVFTRIRKLD
ncbi:MAG: hypothetical protein ACI8XO_000185 [Verrucomicrobiales bacterium]|jgi:hypothetical protein